MYYLLSLTGLTCLDVWFLAVSLKRKVFRSMMFIIGVSIFGVLCYEYYREIQILLTGAIPAPSYYRARYMFYEGMLFGALFREVLYHYEKIHYRKS